MKEATVQRLAARVGFELAGIAPIAALPDASVYLEWVSRGLAGRMSYLDGRRAHMRQDPRSLLPSARSIICVARLYAADASGAPIARYAQGPDYHHTMARDLERLASDLHAEFGDFEHRVCVDTAPLLERSYARAAGLGWIGRNTCLINQQLGSWFILGELLTSLDLEPGVPAPDRCGTCTNCIDACPTAALQPGGFRTELDSTRCISYLTIELKGEIPEPSRDMAGTHAFGCDICQEVCPWNPESSAAAPPWVTLDDLAALTPDEFRRRFRDTPLWRSKYSGLLRNVAVAMGNSGEARYIEPLSRLAASDDALVASHAVWALAQLKNAQ